MPKQGEQSAALHGSAAPPVNATANLTGTLQITEPGVPDQLFGFLGTLVWATLIAALIFVFRKHVGEFLTNLNARLAGGSAIEMPWLKLGAVTPQSPEQQAAGIAKAIHQATPNEAQELKPRVVEDDDREKARFVAVEDLALREVQAEFETPMSRQIQVAGQPFDAMFAVGQVVYLVTVADVSGSKTSNFALAVITMLAQPISKIGWKNARGLMALVYDDADVDLLQQKEVFLQQAKLMIVPIEIRAYKLQDLEVKYGIKVPR
jgi:hypothetical protein